MEFSKVGLPALARIYDTWSFQVLATAGRADGPGMTDSYRYLAESIRRFPTRKAWPGCCVRPDSSGSAGENLSGGICAIHRGARV